jgi:hypothetical protein
MARRRALLPALHGQVLRGGKTIAARWEIAEDGKTWETDFDLIYTKVD